MKVCEICGKEYTPRATNQKYCSKECRREFLKAYYKKHYQEHKEERIEYAHNYYRDHYSVMAKCRAKHNGCFGCPTLDGDCIYD